MSFFEDTGVLILGTRLKRLSEKFLSEVARIYTELEIDFEPAWFPVIFLLHKKGPLSVTAISEELNVSQPAASQITSLLVKKGLLQMVPDKNDKRRKHVSFTETGQRTVQELVPIWEILEKSMIDLFGGPEKGREVVDSFNTLENQLSRISFGDSVLDKLKNNQE